KVLVQMVIHDTPEQAVLVGLTGLLKTASLENPKLFRADNTYRRTKLC
ncbi:MAG: hypothetical protein HC896_02985, partial [Bacteroidales bacterium]|nr:hypothetical protein [Bacteroidales bacterium]